jgi:hypothetical protein
VTGQGQAKSNVIAEAGAGKIKAEDVGAAKAKEAAGLRKSTSHLGHLALSGAALLTTEDEWNTQAASMRSLQKSQAIKEGWEPADVFDHFPPNPFPS